MNIVVLQCLIYCELLVMHAACYAGSIVLIYIST